MPIHWTKKPGDVWSGAAGPFVVKIEPKGDGRWSWHVFTGDAPNPTAVGVASSLGGAKNVTEQFVARSGRA